MRLDGKVAVVAVVTGGTSGIGLAIADALAAAHRRLGESALAVQGDVTRSADLELLFETTAECFGEVDVPIANAGGINFTPLGQSPGPNAAEAPTPGDMADQITRQIPLGQWGRPDDVAKAAVFLAGDDSSYITGADLHVGGGIGMGWVPPSPS